MCDLENSVAQDDECLELTHGCCVVVVRLLVLDELTDDDCILYQLGEEQPQYEEVGGSLLLALSHKVTSESDGISCY